MSYNIDTVSYLSGKLTINREVAHGLIVKYRNDLPEDCFLDDLELIGPGEDDLVITRPSWRGERSGWAYDTLKVVLARTKGDADLLLIWEGGDNQSGIKVRDGKVTETKVKSVLED